MNHPTPQGLPPHFPHEADRETGEGLEPAYSVSKLHEYAERYAREALAAQAATLEAICKIIECAGPEAADEIADLLGYPSVEWPSDQALTAPNLACKSAQARLATQWGYVRAASVEPVGRVARVEWCAHEQKWRHVIWADKKVPFGTPVFASSPSPASVQNASLVEKLAKRTCEANADSARFTIALQTLRASLDPDDWMGAVTMHNYIDAVLAGGSPLQQHPAPSPAQATPVCGAQNAESYPQAPLSLTAAPQEWSPAYTRGPARQSAPVAAADIRVPLTLPEFDELPDEVIDNACVAGGLYRVDLMRAYESLRAHGIGLTVGDGGEG